MKFYTLFTICVFVCASSNILFAQEKDTIRTVDVEEVVVISSPKSNEKLRQQPTGVTLISKKQMEEEGISSVKKLTSIAPNIFIPDYGSRLTSAIYIRGIGSRINTPSVGLYVDDVPFIDKSAFDFSYNDIDRIDILRGPQGTLYGRNSMGGIIQLHTKSPFMYQGTDVKLSAGNHNIYSASLAHYHRISSKLAFSASGFYDYDGGFFTNATLDEKIDHSKRGGGRLRAIYFPSDNWKFDITLNYEHSSQGGYPYGIYDKTSGTTSQPSYNQESSYSRNLLNGGINIEHQAKDFVFTAVTGYQWLKDHMMIDQDFSPKSIYTLEQKQKIHTISEEITFKAKPGRRWQWATGIFSFYQNLKTDALVTFKEDGMQMLSNTLSNNIPSKIDVAMGQTTMRIMPTLTLTNNEMPIPGLFSMPTVNAALYHQSSFKRLFGINGLSFTAGLRLDYEKLWIDYDSQTTMNYNIAIDGKMTMGERVLREIQMMPETPLTVTSSYIGKLNKDYLHLVPKIALQYDFKDKKGNVYFNVSNGFRSGGYNIQMFSDLLQVSLKNDMMNQTRETVLSAVPASYKGFISSYFPEGGENIDVVDAIEYKPEKTWNYEFGTHLNLLKDKLHFDAVLFYLDTRDQQISRFSENGLGRITVNAGKSHSKGLELSAKTTVTKSISLNLSYGYTHATFKDYETNCKVNGNIENISYNGNYVPFVPMHTLHMGGAYALAFKKDSFIQHATLNVNYTGAGRIYWTEANDVYQKFYGTVGARISLQHKQQELDFWVDNIFNKRYTTFYFESMNTGFAQLNRPTQFGMDLKLHF